jgi:hypothetical protein
VRFRLSVTFSVTVLGPGVPTNVKLVVAPVPNWSALAELPWNQRYVHGVAAQVPVNRNVVALYRIAGCGDTLKFATGDWA